MNNLCNHAQRIGKITLLAGLTVAVLSTANNAYAKTIDVEAGPLISKFFADIRCKRAAVKSNGKWTGKYWLKPGSLDGYCQIVVPDPIVIKAPPKPIPSKGKVISVNADRIWNQNHANSYCPQLAKKRGGRWTGRWSDKKANTPAYCQVRLIPIIKVAPHAPKITYETIKVKAGRIWNQEHANTRCIELAKEHRGTWTKRWSSVGSKSSCEIKVAVKPTYTPPVIVKAPQPKPPRRDRHSIREVSAGGIWDNNHATRKCTVIAEQTNGTWTGKWRKTGTNNDAVCEIKYAPIARPHNLPKAAPKVTRNVREVPSGYIWDQNQANSKCPLYAAQNNGRWTGKWRKISTNNRAVCEVELSTTQALPVVTAAPTTYVEYTAPAAAPATQNTREIAAGPIWDDSQAKTKCPYIASNNKGTWTGNWRKTGPNHASLCEVRF